MLLRAVLISLFLWPSILLSESDAPQSFAERNITMSETLQMMAYELRQDKAISNVEIDYEAEAVTYELTSGPEGKAYAVNLHAKLQNEPDDTARWEIFKSHMQVIVESLAAADGDETLDMTRVFPVLRHESLAENFASMEAGQRPYSSGEFGDVKVFYVVDSEASVAYVQHADLDEAGMTSDEFDQRAEQNLEELYEGVILEGDDPFFLTLDGFYEASLLLHTPLWDELDKHLGEIVMAFPTRDIVIFTDGQNAGAEEFLVSAAQELAAEGAYPLSDYLYVWKDGHWVAK